MILARKPDALPSPLRGGAGGRAAAATAQVKPQGWEREATGLATVRMKGRANALRRRLTEPEKRLWWHLRHSLALEGTHFRRQVAIGRYVVDFCCLSSRLVIEVDGGQHGLDEHRLRDEARDRELDALGFRVLRFSNREVMTATSEVLDTIYAACSTTPPTPGPSPRGGGEIAQRSSAQP